MGCQSITLIIHQELGVIPLQIQWLNHCDVLIEFDSEVDVGWVVQKLFRMEWWMGAPCNLGCVPCSNEGLWQFRGGEWIAPGVDPEWIDPSRWVQVAPTGCVGWPHPDNYGVPQFLDAIQSGHNIMALRGPGDSCLAVFSGIDPPLPKGEATYNQWAFEVQRLWSHYQEEVLYESIIQLLKGDAADMVRFLGRSCTLCWSNSGQAWLFVWFSVHLWCHNAGIL